MRKVSLHEWGVRHLVLTGSMKHPDCKRALVAALPQVRTFNGQDRKVYLKEVEDWDWMD